MSKNLGSMEELFKNVKFTKEEKEIIRIEKELVEACIKGRKSKQISQIELSEMTGIPQPTIARIESGSNMPNLNTLMKYLYALGYSLKVVKL